MNTEKPTFEDSAKEVDEAVKNSPEIKGLNFESQMEVLVNSNGLSENKEVLTKLLGDMENFPVY